MKIIFLTGVFPPATHTSVGSIVQNLGINLQNFGHEVLIVAPTHDKSAIGLYSYEGLNVQLIYNNHSKKMTHYFNLFDFRIQKQFKKIIYKFKPDVVHAHVIQLSLSFPCLKIAKKSGAKVFFTAHDCLTFHYGKLTEFILQNDKNKIYQEFNYYVNNWQLLKRYKKRFIPFRRTIIKHYFKYVDKIFAVSSELKKALMQNGLTNVEVLHNGIDTNLWKVDQGAIDEFKNKHNLNQKNIVLLAGRLNSLKGGGLLINALEKVVQKIPNTVLLIIGQKDATADNFLKLSNGKNVSSVFTNWLTQKEIAVAYHASDIVVVPSGYLDPFPTINLEAGACAKPVIGTNLGGTKEIIIDNQTGYIVNPYNQEMLSEKIIDLLQNSSKAKNFGQSAFEHIKKNFSLNKQLQETVQWYNN